ncbi:reverse transcriptase domain-containing protein [Rhizobium sp. SL86]|uniref:reverse transcriptase domain-containing protein n=1 Tax=Rhizobium sp. SL86 TaxID=2995148 RepID=UPI0022768E0A|nr:reverse transcriptase domain-containing protein [Rhizobium sp. SL86]MCY1667737.1 reverse transcriptase domain-containing protein [Rhizobium sp. SL86]
MAVTTVLNAIYEQDFLGFSYGFRQGRGQHDALDALWVGIDKRKINWILDADIRSFYDEIDHEWMLRFLSHRVGDRRLIRLIYKWLKAGTIEDGRRVASTRGTPQGSVISPVLSNIYLHYALDLWVQQWRTRHAKGDVIIVRYADDSVTRVPVRRRGAALSASIAGAARSVRLATTPGEDAADSLRAVCRATMPGTWYPQARDLRLSGIHALLRQAAQ